MRGSQECDDPFSSSSSSSSLSPSALSSLAYALECFVGLLVFFPSMIACSQVFFPSLSFSFSRGYFTDSGINIKWKRKGEKKERKGLWKIQEMILEKSNKNNMSKKKKSPKRVIERSKAAKRWQVYYAHIFKFIYTERTSIPSHSHSSFLHPLLPSLFLSFFLYSFFLTPCLTTHSYHSFQKLGFCWSLRRNFSCHFCKTL